jgi:sugar lactone lactonase YvrE
MSDGRRACYHLDKGERIGVYELDERPVLHGFNDIALARDGTVYVTDSTQGAIYRLERGAGKLERWVQDDRMTVPNGIVLSPDDKRLYVAHWEGLSVIDTKKPRAKASRAACKRVRQRHGRSRLAQRSNSRHAHVAVFSSRRPH